MRKKLWALLLAACMVVSIFPTVSLADDTTATEMPVPTEGVITLTQDVSLTSAYTVASGTTVTIDLNGHNITATDCGAIVNRGTLTVTGSGIVSTTGGGNDCAAIGNCPGGTVTLNGGTYQTEKWYVIKNLGTMTISGAVTVKKPDNSTDISSLIDNGWYGNANNDTIGGTDYSNSIYYNPSSAASLTITGSNFIGKSGTKSSSVIKNDDYGTLNISGGTFDSTNNTGTSDATTILNWNVATISGGTFKGSYPISNGNCSDTADKGELTISGGTFTGTHFLFRNNGGATANAGKIEITDGTFNAPVVLDDDTSFTYAVVVKGGQYSNSVSDSYLDESLNAELVKANSNTPYSYYTSVEDAQEAAGENDVVVDLTKEAAGNAQILSLGFDADAATANSRMSAIVETLGGPANFIKDCDENTMWAFVNVPDGSDYQYELRVTNLRDETVYSSIKTDAEGNTYNELSGDGDSAIYFTFKQSGGSPSLKEIASGTYMVRLYKIEATAADSDTPSTSEVVDSVPDSDYISISEVSYDLNGGTMDTVPAAKYYETGKRVTYPEGTPTKEEYRFTSWTPVCDAELSTADETGFVAPEVAVVVTAQYDAITYKVTADEAENGTVAVDKTEAAKGETVTITTTPDADYELDTLTVTDKDGKEVEVKDNAFTMPGSDVTVKATFKATEKEEPTEPEEPTEYAVTLPETVTGGKVTADKDKAEAGETVTITVTPDDGQKLDTLTVTDKDGKAIEVKDNGDGTYSFTMPEGGATIEATFTHDCPSKKFTDVDTSLWYHEPIDWAILNDITYGTTATTFSPDEGCTRAQAVSFIWRAAGCPEPKSTTMKFTDVSADEYYYRAILWAVEEGITVGTSETTFSPNDVCTRGQIVTMLYRQAGEPTVEKAKLFSDVSSDAFYYSAVRWAVSKGITVGTSDTTFSPDDTCTRAQIVTFLYRSTLAD